MLQIKREQRRLRKHYQEKYAKAVKHMQENSGLRANWENKYFIEKYMCILDIEVNIILMSRP